VAAGGCGECAAGYRCKIKITCRNMYYLTIYPGCLAGVQVCTENVRKSKRAPKLPSETLTPVAITL